MLHPIGSRRPAVYWRRRFALFIALLVLVVLTAWVLRPGGAKKSSAASTPSHTAAPSSSVAAPSTSPHPSSAASTEHPSTSAKPSKSGSPTRAAASAPCRPAALKVAAAVGRASYSVGDQPLVMLQVTNTATAPCVQNLADSQIELRVYNGESRVWGSHDCTIQPGVSDRTLAIGQPVRVSIVWSGLSSQPKCAGTRQRVGAGTYTLYALLSGHEGTAAQFSIS